MTDRNTISQVIESLFEDWIDRNTNVHPLAVENMRILEADALALLKEQEVVVRCKDCKYYDYFNGCMSWHDVNSKNDNWYCADGERK